MVFSKELIDLLQLLRKRFKEEKLGILQLSSPAVLDDMVAMATLSECNITKDLTYTAIQLAELPLSREDLDGSSYQESGRQSEGGSGKTYRVYRGQRIEVEAPAKTSKSTEGRKVRVYRGQVVA